MTAVGVVAALEDAAVALADVVVPEDDAVVAAAVVEVRVVAAGVLADEVAVVVVVERAVVRWTATRAGDAEEAVEPRFPTV